MTHSTLRCAAAGVLFWLTACSAGRLPELPRAAEYERSCEDIVLDYQAADGKASNRKATAYSLDSAIALTAIGITVATSGAAGPGVPIAAIVLSQAKGDLGHEKIALRRSMLQQMAVRKGCTFEEVAAVLEAARAPAASTGNDPN